MHANFPVSSLPRPPIGQAAQIQPHFSFQATLSISTICTFRGLVRKSGSENIDGLYEFLMKFNVFIYAVNSVESFPRGRSVFIAERAERHETFRFFKLSPRLVSFFNLEARAFCSL
jgi:hypothetical protein